MGKPLPLYLTVYAERLVRVTKDGCINWSNTQWYEVGDLHIILNLQKRPIHIIPWRWEHATHLTSKNEILAGVAHYRWYYIPRR